ncbi:MAG: hypothetical protein J0G29_04195 [Alphaproteobacteria bacterium]|nr:hypothetical protein [Alphaproteobacteria bacterium]OJV44989.1 MAG: hypothetical protein BGO28_05480 [Alphaproteobacteria bacterium 43-37]
MSTKIVYQQNSLEKEALFRVVVNPDEQTKELKYFNSITDAFAWLQAQGREGIIHQRHVTEWALPIDRKIPVISWVSV